MLLQKLRGNKKKGREGWGEGQRKYGYLLRTVSMKHMKSVLLTLKNKKNTILKGVYSCIYLAGL